MICPVKLANEVSAFGGVGLVLFVEAHEALLGNRSGAGDESTRSDHAGDERRDRLVSSCNGKRQKASLPAAAWKSHP